MKEVELAFWIIVTIVASLYIAAIVGGWISDAMEERRIRRIFGPKNNRKDKP